MKALKIGLLVGSLLAGVFLIYAIFSFWSVSSKQKTVAEAWRRTTGMTPEELIQSCAKTETNATARELEKLAAKLEIGGEANDGEGENLARDFFADRRIGDSDRADELPENVRKYLANHQTDLNRLYDFVLQNPAPESEIDLSRPGIATLPNLGFHIRLHEIIALDVLDKTNRNQNEQAIKAMQASWKASEFLREQPEIALQMINLTVISTQNYALRKMREAPANWREQFSKIDYRALAPKVLQREYTFAYFAAKSQNSSALQNFAARLSPFSELNSALEVSAVGQETVAQLQQRDFCDFGSGFDFDSKIAWRNRAGRIVFPASLQIWRNFGELSYDIELTEQVLRLKESKRSTPQIAQTKSTLCRDSQWIIEKQPNGSLEIRFSNAADLILDKQTPLTYALQAKNAVDFK